MTSLVGAIYFFSIVQMFTNFQPTIIIFQGEKPVFIRDRNTALYDIWIYTFCKFLAELPILLVVPMIQNLALYWCIGFQPGIGHFFQFYIVIVLTVQAATALGYALSALFDHATTAVAMAPIFSISLNVLGGYMVNLKTLHGPQLAIGWLQYISPTRFGFAGLMQAQFPVE